MQVNLALKATMFARCGVSSRRSPSSCCPHTFAKQSLKINSTGMQLNTRGIFQIQAAKIRLFSTTVRSITASSAEQSSDKVSTNKAKVVFLGTPKVAASTLETLIKLSTSPEAKFEISAVVSQPGKPRGRGRNKVPAPSPVAEMAEQQGLNPDNILTPFRAKEEEFLEAMEKLAPDLCVTAAYGNMLPQRFLDIPKYGTLNIHPSLLPQFRGAAPVQRAIEAGVSETGVSVAYTVLACDAGPVLASEIMQVDDEVQHPDLLAMLFEKGTALLVKELESGVALDGSGMDKAVPQDESKIIHADKVSMEESVLDFTQDARTLHNKVRGFAGWPGTKATFIVENNKGGEDEVTLKVIKTQIGEGPREEGLPKNKVTYVNKKALQVECDDGSLLEILELQPPGKKVQPASAFCNGLQGRSVMRT